MKPPDESQAWDEIGKDAGRGCNQHRRKAMSKTEMVNVGQVTAAHTPGPWAAEWTHRSESLVYGWHVGQPDSDNTVCVIEDERGSDVDVDRREADARLMAASPDMLKALQCVVAALTQNATFPADIALAVKVAKDAIAKATTSETP